MGSWDLLAILEQKAAETAANRAFEEKQPLVFFTEIAIHGGVRPLEREY